MVVSIIFLPAQVSLHLTALIFFTDFSTIRRHATTLYLHLQQRSALLLLYLPSALINISVCFCFLLRFILRTNFLHARAQYQSPERRLFVNFPPVFSTGSRLFARCNFYRQTVYPFTFPCLPRPYFSRKFSRLPPRQAAWNSVADAYLNRSVVRGAKISARLPDDPATSSFPFLFLYFFFFPSLSFFPSLFLFSTFFRTIIPLTTPQDRLYFR